MYGRSCFCCVNAMFYCFAPTDVKVRENAAINSDVNVDL
jgi:hypothetical protein